MIHVAGMVVALAEALAVECTPGALVECEEAVAGCKALVYTEFMDCERRKSGRNCFRERVRESLSRNEVVTRIGDVRYSRTGDICFAG